MKNKIKEFCFNLGIEYTGITKWEDKTAIVMLFPYYTQKNDSANISLYCYSYDYHKIIQKYLNSISEFLKNEYKAEIYGKYSDISPYKDIDLATRAGLGIKGRNNLLINEKYGSFVFIGYIITNLDIEEDLPLKKTCLMCGKCLDSCPSGCLNDNNYSVCLSHITQKKGELTSDEQNLLKKSNLIFGCDICQLVCPMNTFKVTPLKEFKDNHIYVINKTMLQGLSNKRFKELYSDRAFAWRGKNILLRNIDIISHE